MQADAASSVTGSRDTCQPARRRVIGQHVAALLATALLAGLYARGGLAWVLGFVALLPWLRALDGLRSVTAVLVSALLMTVLWTAAAFGWFGGAIGRFTGVGEVSGMAVLLLIAPVLQPQIIIFALVRRVAARAFGSPLGAMAGCMAWVAADSLLPKLLGDTLGHGLYPSPLLRQGAALVGANGLSLVLLLSNEALAAALRRYADGAQAPRANGAPNRSSPSSSRRLRATLRPLALAALAPLLLAAAGWIARPAPTHGAPTLRMALVQSNIIDYERLRREKGAGAVVRQVLDTHYAMSHDAVERQRAQAVLWSETVYPTTFARPKSEAGAELDTEIVGIVNAAGVPFVFGTYDRDGAGEYNAAAFVAPGQGLVGFYRKTRLFPFTETVPDWLDGPLLQRWLPWSGRWRAGDGARVLPLRLADGREVPVLPLICLDAVDPGLAIAGARLGAQLILSLSNDSWFTEQTLGAQLHLAVAAFRSIETGLPQFRVTSNGFSAVIDVDGSVLAGTRMGERTLVVGELPLRDPPPTAMLAWGDWVGRACALLLLALAFVALARSWRGRHPSTASPDRRGPSSAQALPDVVWVLPPAARWASALLRVLSRGSLLVMAAAALWADGTWAGGTLAQLRSFGTWFLAPELAACCLLLAFRARPAIDGSRLVLSRGTQRLEVSLGEPATMRAWRLPLPAPGITLHRVGDAGPGSIALAGIDVAQLADPLFAAGGSASVDVPPRLAAWQQALRSVPRSRLDSVRAKFGLLPLLLAIPAFRLHQHIAYGGSFGEWLSFGALAFAKGFALWWAAWAMGVVLVAAVLRALVEAGTLLALAWRPEAAAPWRTRLHRLMLSLLYLGLPTWLAWRALGG